MKNLQNKKYLTLHILALFLFFYCYATASTPIYPTVGWETSTPEAQGMQSQKLAEMMSHIQKNEFPIDSILIVRNGYLVLDAYFYPFSNKQKHNIMSCTKSIVSALIGIAIDKGYIKDVKQPITDFFPDKAFATDALKKSITLENLLMMASGLKCRDSYLYRHWGFFDMRASHDWVQFVLDLPMAASPGEKFKYCNGVSYLLSAIVQNTTKMKTFDFARTHLFEPLGIADVEWERSPQGIDVGYGAMWLKPHDMAKIGWLYLNKGRWGNKQIVSSAWVAVSTRGHIDATLFDRYGYHWWVDSSGYYMAVGHRGQRIFVVPDKNLVAVFTGSGGRSQFLKNMLEFYIIPSASSPDALPASPQEQARLDAFVTSAARPIAFTWTSEDEGVARDGVFTRTASPAFQFKYPIGSKKAATNGVNQVMRMHPPAGSTFFAAIVDIPGSLKLKDFGPKFYAQDLGIFVSNVNVISNEEITLKCGTKAYRTDMTYLWKGYVPFTAFLVSAYKDGKCIFVSAHSWKNHDDYVPIVESLTLK
ncbi:MAG: serine hydrolase [Desulfobacterales bacterium]|jgi:CubicO group peptidase (beta-lactamase class C family)